MDIEVDNDGWITPILQVTVYYNDHSYQEGDDDHLYETFVDDQSEFVGFPNTNETQPEVEEYDDQGMLSDGDIKYDSDYSLGSTSDEEIEGKKKTPSKTFKAETNMEDPKFKIDMYFSTPKDFKAAVKQHAILHQRPIKLLKNDKRRNRTRCEKLYQWEVCAAKVLGECSYQVRTYSAKHNCIKTYTNMNVTSHTIARRNIVGRDGCHQKGDVKLKGLGSEVGVPALERLGSEVGMPALEGLPLSEVQLQEGIMRFMPEVEEYDDQGMLSDGDIKYDLDYSVGSTSDEETKGKMKAPFKTFKAETNMEDPKFKIGMYFSTPKDFKEAVKQHAILHQIPVK
ncbi:hypothetical protein Vadar_021240 [Vaccinium darrowii]|uniref:Uncharacterized protein n=1 Tax=Vaccinium darrowii TaxID=229202 RepID=A0ACB7YEU6_9ERIC|nr:hypothetical protein Vadar_021240 [Vaccinium darrowii]